jgi:hypothetical protein
MINAIIIHIVIPYLTLPCLVLPEVVMQDSPTYAEWVMRQHVDKAARDSKPTASASSPPQLLTYKSMKRRGR